MICRLSFNKVIDIILSASLSIFLLPLFAARMDPTIRIAQVMSSSRVARLVQPTLDAIFRAYYHFYCLD